MQNIDEKYILDNFDAAIKGGHIKPFFQPIIRSLTGEVCAAETLARWDDPIEGLLAPYLFIDVLERRRLIHKLDLKMIENICYGYTTLMSKGYTPLPFSVNLSRLDFEQKDIFEQIMAIFEKYNVPTSAVHLEITESVMLDNVENFRPIFNRFKEAGFEMWLDDFGSGYTSLNVLKDYEFDVLKIDMKFLSSIDSRSRLLIGSVINMSKKMGIHTLAEGVETKEQEEFLRSMGCELLQGYYYAKPMSPDDFENFFIEKKLKKENPREREYYKAAGLLNFLSTSPFDEFTNIDEYGGAGYEESQVPLQIWELCDGKLNLLYMGKSYSMESAKLGLYDEDEVIALVNDRTKPFYYDTIRQIELTAQSLTGIVRKDYMMGDICYSFTTKLLARTAHKIMVAVNLLVYGGEEIENRFEDISKYSRALFYNYENVSMVYPDSDSTKHIYLNTGFSKTYRTISLRRSIKVFTEAELHDDDKERYLDFMDLDTIYDRIIEDNCTFVQQPFRMRTPDGTYRWRLVRMTKIPTADGTNCYMYSIQRMPPVDVRVIEEEITKNPDMFKR
ncbi:MAG: EAL domain-containing protein [Firmicutes bacterium]|nr:EAL domain-containing protein [Bacillota bacterium]